MLDRMITKLLSGFPEERETAAMIFANLPELTTERLILRKLRLSDAEDVFAFSSDPLVSEHVLWEPHADIGESRAYIRAMRRQYRAGLPCSYGIVLKETNKVIGTIGFMWYSEEHSSAEVGYSLCRSRWGQGLATEALRAVIDMGFKHLKLHRIEAQHEIANPASGRVMAKCGMRQEGVLRGRVHNKNHYSDVALWAILREDYLSSTRSE